MIYISIELYDHQREAVKKMKNGCILCGGVGTGKSRTAIAYYFKHEGGTIDSYSPMVEPKDLYIITTARKRDTLEWEGELSPFLLSTHADSNGYSNKVVVDSWNNIGKYEDTTGSFFIFDEQRVVGHGAWVKSFLKIAKSNEWILLSATPGDTWMDYIPVFIANGFYKNRTEFIRRHVIFNRFAKYPKVDRYINCQRLVNLKHDILVNMRFTKPTTPHKETVVVDYDKDLYFDAVKTRWNPYSNKPIKNVSEFCQTIRRINNSSIDRKIAVSNIVKNHPRTIIFYNFDYELEILKMLGEEVGIFTAELNGHRHDPIPNCDEWIYLVQYSAGSEAWNCITTNTIIFYSLNYSYRMMSQSAGRIDRLNTPYTDLYYYYIRSKAPIDIGIERTLNSKKDFNEKDFVGDISFD